MYDDQFIKLRTEREAAERASAAPAPREGVYNLRAALEAARAFDVDGTLVGLPPELDRTRAARMDGQDRTLAGPV